MAKRTGTRATATVKNARKARAARPARAKAKTPAKTADAESPKAKKAKIVPPKSVTAKATTSTGKDAKAKRAAPTKAQTGAAAPKAAAKAKPASTKATRKAKAPSKTASAKASPKTKTATKAASTKRKASAKPKTPRFLAAELGHPVDHEGEPIGAGSRAALADTELQRYTLQLWRQMQSRRGVNTHIPAMERAGVTIDQIWTAGVTDRLTTSSTPDEVKRYRQKLLFRANLLESILTETVDELQRLGTIDPTPPPAVGEPG